MKKNRVFKSAKKFLLLFGIAALSFCFIPKAFTQAPWSSQGETAARTKAWKGAEAAKPVPGEDAVDKNSSSLEFLSEGEWNAGGNIIVDSGKFAPAQ